MKAEDTVTKTTDENCHNTLEERLSEQAEITWDKAIREVVEWMKENVPEGYDQVGEEKPLYLLYVDKELWQAQLKEWGIR